LFIDSFRELQEKENVLISLHKFAGGEDRLETGAGPGKDSRLLLCLLSLDFITTQPAFSKEKWGEIVAKMVKVYGAPIPQDVAKEITLYLGASYGKSSQ
jgi:hypothetical protein